MFSKPLIKSEFILPADNSSLLLTYGESYDPLCAGRALHQSER